MNPELDIGQAEGGFVMGLGYFLQEDIKYDEQTGQVLNAGTWVITTCCCLLLSASIRLCCLSPKSVSSPFFVFST